MKEFSFDIVSDDAIVKAIVKSDKRVHFVSSSGNHLSEPQVRRLFNDRIDQSIRILNVSGLRLQYAGVVKSISNIFAEVRIGDLYTFDSIELILGEQYVHKVEVDIESRKLQIEYALNIVFSRATEKDQKDFLMHLLNRLNLINQI